MGQARKRREAAQPTVYHHTSTLRTNLLWMSGVVEVEGKSEGVLHPQFGEIHTDALARRAMEDFPPVAWFTRRIDVPRCLVQSALYLLDKQTGEKREYNVEGDVAHALSLNRVALGFPVAEIPVVPWPDYRGYGTAEGRTLNETARAAGDNPNDWFVSETPVDLLKVSEFWTAPKMSALKLKRFDAYLPELRRMVKMCRETEGIYIPPTRLKREQAVKLAEGLGVEVLG